MKKLSIVIVNYRTGKFLQKCVQSIKKNTQGVDYEVIVIDNDKNNVGFARAANQGIRKAKGKYILLLNPDTRVKNGAIKRLLEFARKTQDAGVVGARLLNPDGSVQPSVYHFPTLWRAIREYLLGQRGAYEKYAPDVNSAEGVDAVAGAAFLITPQARKKVGLLDERYFMYFEDLDYCRRIKAVGLNVYYLPQAEVVHEHGASGRGLADEKNQWRRLIPSSKIYHGLVKHYLITFILWSGQKWRRS